MNWWPVARMQLTTTSRSKVVWFLAALVTIAVVGVAWTLPDQVGSEPNLYAVDTANYAEAVLQPIEYVVPIVAIVVAYRALAAERDAGTIKHLLSAPRTRLDVYAGKFLGSSAVVLCIVLAGLVLAGLVGATRHDQFVLVDLLALSLATTGLAVAFVSLSLSVSASTGTTRTAGAGAFGLYLIFGVAWDLVTALVRGARNLVVEGTLQAGPDPDWFWLLDVAGPNGAFRRIVLQGIWRPEDGRFAVDDLPWQLDWQVAVVSLALWIVLPLLFGYFQLERADL